MGKTFQNCDDDVSRLAAQAITKYMRELSEYGVRVFYQFVYAARDERTGEPKGTALTHGGYPADAVIKINSLQARVEGLADATVRIDGDKWKDMTDREREALLAHELRHLELVTDDEGNVQTDDAGRPRLRLRPHDAQVGVFYDVAEWYGKDAADAKAVQALHAKWQALDLFALCEQREPAAAV